MAPYTTSLPLLLKKMCTLGVKISAKHSTHYFLVDGRHNEDQELYILAWGTLRSSEICILSDGLGAMLNNWSKVIAPFIDYNLRHMICIFENLGQKITSKNILRPYNLIYSKQILIFMPRNPRTILEKKK